MKISVSEMNNISNEFLSTFNLKLEIPIVINPRLKRTLGMFVCLPKRKISKRIEISKQLIEVGDMGIIKDTLLHECLHYALFTLGLPYKDSDEHFVSEAKRLTIGLTDEVFVGYEYVVQCNQCSKIAITEIKNQINKKYIGKKYKTNCCKSGYTHIKTVVHNGIEELEIPIK